MSVAFTVERKPEPPPRITDFEDRLLLIHPRRVMDWTHPDGNQGDAVKADLVVLDAEDGPEVLHGLAVIQAALVRVLKQRLAKAGGGQVRTLARLVRIPSKRNPDNRVWVFEEPTENDVDLAQLYLDEYGDPFATAA